MVSMICRIVRCMWLGPKRTRRKGRIWERWKVCWLRWRLRNNWLGQKILELQFSIICLQGCTIEWVRISRQWNIMKNRSSSATKPNKKPSTVPTPTTAHHTYTNPNTNYKKHSNTNNKPSRPFNTSFPQTTK